MTLPVVLSFPALYDRAEAASWYDAQRAGLGDRFKSAVDLKLCVIGERPMSFPAIDELYRRALVEKFPYTIFFRVEADRIFVRAILHGRRDPRMLARRLRGF